MSDLIKFFISRDSKAHIGNRLGILKDFTVYCKKSLKIHQPYDVYLVFDRRQYNIKTSAVCQHDAKRILVYVKGRAFSDILKSISHEMVHVKQHESGEEVEHEFVHFHSRIEDEANVMGVALLNAYAEVKGNDLIFEN